MSMTRYLPDQYLNSQETVGYYEAVSPIVDALQDAKDNIFRQFDIETATWGLALWEQEYDIPTDITKPYDYRRSRLRAKIRGQGTTTAIMLQNMAESFSGGAVEVKELPGQYTVCINFVGVYGTPPNIDDLKVSFEEVKPAHILLTYLYSFIIWNVLDARNLAFNDLDAEKMIWDVFERGEWLNG